MDIGSWVFYFYGFAAVVVGVYLIREVDFGETYMIKKKETRLGPNYWGTYEGTASSVPSSMETIEPPKPCKDAEGGLAGSGAYAGGKAVKSAR